MLSLILTILKIIGIIILVILGLLLLILLLVLFVPIRYRLRAEHGDAFMLDGGVSWLLHLVHGRVHIADQGNRIWFRILGYLVYDSTKEMRKPRTKDRAKHPIKEHKKVPREQQDFKTDGQDIKKTIEEDIKNESDIKITAEDDIKHEPDIKPDIKHNEPQDDTTYKKSSTTRLKARVFAFYKRIKQKIKDFFKKLLNIKHKVSLIISFIRNEVNKEAFRLTFSSFIRLIKHILPTKLKSRLVFGTGDPCSTGQALGVLSILYSFYGDNIEITPDFENKVLKGKHFAKGRIRIWTILIIVIKLLLDERFKKFKTNYQRLKEEF